MYPVAAPTIFNPRAKFSYDIMSGTDPAEEKMDRTAHKVLGVIIGFLLGHLDDLYYLPVSGFLVCDAIADEKKN